jgi:hypothetical protein
MKILFCIYLVCFSYIAQSEKYNHGIPITIESAIKFKTLNEALILSADYEVVECKIVFITKDGIFLPSGPQTLKNPIIRNMLSLSQSGDKLIFSEIIVKHGDQQLKLEDKAYVIQ